MLVFVFFLFADNYDNPAIIGIVLGGISGIIAAFAAYRTSRESTRNNQLALKVSETATVLDSWKEVTDAQAKFYDNHINLQTTQIEGQGKKLDVVETKLEKAIESFHECEKKNANLEGKFEALGVLQINQARKIDKTETAQVIQASKQEIIGTRQDVQETRQNEQEERQNTIEYKAVEAADTLIKKTTNGDTNGDTNSD